MKRTIAVHTNLAWFSKRATKGRYTSAKEALAAHISYVLREEECVYSFNLDKKDWLKRADEYVQKRADSKIAGKKMFVLPRGLSTKEQALLIKEFLTSEELFSIRVQGKRIRVKLDENSFGFALHRGKNSVSGKENPHVHVLFLPKVKYQNKEYSLHVNKRELRELHRKWENFLRSKGFEIKKDPSLGEPHFGPQKLRRESNVFSPRLYEAYRKFRLARQYEERLHALRQRARTRLPREEAELLSWDEIAQEEEKIATRGEKKVERQSPPPRPKPVAKPKPKPVVNPQQPRSVQQPRLRVGLQRPSQVQSEEEVASKDPVKQIRKQVEKELAEKKRREQRLAEEINRSTKQRARTLSESPPLPSASSYSLQKGMEVGNVNGNPFTTAEVVEEQKQQEKEQKLKQVQVYQAEMTITYRYRFVRGELTVRFRTLSNWSAEKRKGIAAFLASVAVAVLYGYKFPREALSFFGSFVEKEALTVREQVKRVIKKPFYSSPEEALRALSVRKTIHVRVRIFEGGKLVEEHNFFLTRESFTILHQYAEAVRKRRRPQPGGQPGQPGGQPPQQPPEPMQEEPDEEDWPEPGM